MFLWKTAEHSSRCVLSGERRRGEMSNIRNKQPCHDNSWRREQYRRESERGEESDRCSEMEIEEDGKGRREKKEGEGKMKTLPHFCSSLWVSLPVPPSKAAESPFLLFFFFLSFTILLSRSLRVLFLFFFFFLTNTVEKPPGVSLGCLTVHTSLAAERGRLLYLLICVFDLLAAIFS